MKQFRILTLLVLLMTAVTGAWAQTGMINGLFSVSPTKRVYFSKGNLQYDGKNWKFAASQWEVLGANGTGANGTATNYPMDLFTWGNIDSPTYNGNTYYTENADLSGITDWGSRMGSGWYTLSKDEWLYLFGMESSNTDKSGHARYRKYFRATVNGLPGIVLLPDDLSGISDIPAESNRGTASNFAKTYTTDAWSAMESAGCVFLPTAGFRKTDASVSHVGWSGFYWESTAYDAGKAYTVGFDNTFVDPAGNFDRTFGFAVRLVIDESYLTLADGTKDAGKWTATVGTSTNAKALPVGGLSKGDAVTLQYTGRLKVKGVKATSGTAPAGKTVDLSTLTADYEAQNGDVLTGTLGANVKISIAAGATVTLDGVNISNGQIACSGNANIILMGANTVTAASEKAAIKIGGPGTTLTITGSGSLTAQGGLEAAGIGTDRNENGELSFGNIVINGGTVTATGGKEGAGIGTGLAQGQFYTTSITCGDITINGGTVTAIGGLYGAGIGTGPTMSDGGSASITCGDITINGGTVTATGGDYGPGIGTGVFLKYGSESASNRCGNITIGAGVTSVTATKGGSYSPNSIGKGYAYGGTQNYGTITIGGTVYATGVTASPFTYTPSN